MSASQVEAAVPVGTAPLTIAILAPAGRWARVVAAEVGQRLGTFGHETVLLTGPGAVRLTAASVVHVVLQLGAVTSRGIGVAVLHDAVLVQAPLTSPDAAVEVIQTIDGRRPEHRPVSELTGHGFQPLLVADPLRLAGGDLELECRLLSGEIDHVRCDEVVVSATLRRDLAIAEERDGRRWEGVVEIGVTGRRGLSVEVDGARYPADVVRIRPTVEALRLIHLPADGGP